MVDQTNSSNRLDEIADRKIVDLGEFKRAQHRAIARIVARVLEDLDSDASAAERSTTQAADVRPSGLSKSEIVPLPTPGRDSESADDPKPDDA